MEEQAELETKEEKPKRHILSSVITFVLVAIFAIGAFVFIWYACDDYSDFDDFSSEAYIECLEDGAEPQSVAVYSPSSGNYSGERCYIVGANAKTGEAVLYISGDTSGYIGRVPLTFCGEPFCGETLIATNGYSVWVASGDTVYVTASSSRSNCNNLIATAASNTEVTKALNGEIEVEEGEEVEEVEIGEIESYDLTNSFCVYMDIGFISAYGTTRLYIGENSSKSFKKSGHAAKTPSGDKNTAFVYEYTTDTSDKTYGLSYITGYDEDGNEKTVPSIYRVYSVTGNVNGWARTTDGALVLSQGATLSSSHILVYDWDAVSSSSNRTYYKNLEGFSNYRYEGLYRDSTADYTVNNLYVYYVDSSKLTEDLTVPPLVAGISAEASSDNVHILFESGYGSNRTLARRVEKSIYGFTPTV